MARKMWYDVTPVGNYVVGNISKIDLERKLELADPSMFEMLNEAEQLVGNAYMSSFHARRKAIISSIAPMLIAGTLGILGKILGILPTYESAAYFAGFTGALSLPISYGSYLASESAGYLRKTKKAARIVARTLTKTRRKEFPCLARHIEEGKFKIDQGSIG